LASPPDADAIVREIGRVLRNEAYAPGVDFSRWDSIAKIHRQRIRAAKTNDEFALALTTALQALGSSHVGVFTPEFMKAPFTSRGAGVVAYYDEESDETVIARVFPKSPAERAGIRCGDVVVEEKDLYSGMDGKPAKPSWVRVRRGERELEFHLKPTQFSLFGRPELDWVDSTTAVLNVPTFTDFYDKARVERLMREAAVAERLILDLRFNSGGKPWNVEHLLGFFLPDRAFIGSFVGRADAHRFAQKNPRGNLSSLAASVVGKMRVKRTGPRYGGRVVVLVNEFSGSASEVAAQALREIGRVPVYGESTAGAVLVSDSRNLPGGFALVFPGLDYVSAGGKRLERHPVKPDVTVRTVDVGWPGRPDTALLKVARYLESVAFSPARRVNNPRSRA
jgi:C-terminal processing protease CtpA/Prc